MRRILAGLVLSWLLACPAWARPPVWVVRDADSEMVIFGSVHLLPAGLDWRPARLDQALAAADDLWFEIPPDASVNPAAAAALAARGVLPPGQSLSTLLSPRGRQRLTAAGRRLGLPPGTLERLKPWYAEVVLAGAEYQRAGAERLEGVEAVLASAGPPGRPRLALETVQAQIDLFDGLPLEDQTASLEETLRDLGGSARAFDALVKAWMAGDLKTLDREALGPLRRASPRLYDRLVRRRNQAWVQSLDARLKGKGRSVVVVGVGHLIGDDGLPARLRALGYSVEGP